MSLRFTRFQILAVIPFSLAVSGYAAAQEALIASADLPDAPSVVQAVQQTGSLAGVVKDVNGGLVQAATVTAASLTGTGEFSATADSAGHFSLDSLPAGRYKITVSAEGLKPLILPTLEVGSGVQTLPEIALAAASTTADVSVIATQDQIAIEQVHAQEEQRAFGFVPNFYTSYIWRAAPMPTKQKFGLATHSAFDPVGLISITGIAGVEQWRNIYSGYGDDAGAFGKRYAAAFGDEIIGRYFGSAIYPTLFHQDPRYFYKGSGSVGGRAWYAVSRTFVTRGEDGRAQPNYSRILGRFTAGAIANAYHPHADRGVGLTVTNAMINLGGNAFDNLFREFVLRKITPNLPAYANGESGPNP